MEPVFHPDSYGYRPGKSALDAVRKCRERCWKKDWVIDLDVRKLFDSVRWDLIVKAVEAHTEAPWVLLYVQRWLQAPIRQPDGSALERTRGTPQGSAVSPVPANLFLHYALDAWLVREFPTVEFERYADDAVLHCVTERQARHVLAALHERMGQVGLTLHPAKTQIVYCKDANRRLKHGTTQFTFLGFTFRPRTATAKDGTLFMSFLPAISKDALNKISNDVRSWRLHRRIGSTFAQLAKAINPIVQGWMQYYGAFYRTVLYPFLERINSYLMRWIRKKYRRLRTIKKALRAFQNAVRAYPAMFRHWQWVPHAWRTG
ncbi:group II intron reverse transcriptase/maturase [Streptosporangium canum]|uniref:Group II intron reverse transcriptase/maturase n=1 Tax=Streptosporangium canum TaxID=324952 RepID=A0A1I4FYJ5_9ACTN|nr:group II intron reverse transcriptase/maturase [Streptosporangium canum]